MPPRMGLRRPPLEALETASPECGTLSYALILVIVCRVSFQLKL